MYLEIVFKNQLVSLCLLYEPSGALRGLFLRLG